MEWRQDEGRFHKCYLKQDGWNHFRPTKRPLVLDFPHLIDNSHQQSRMVETLTTIAHDSRLVIIPVWRIDRNCNWLLDDSLVNSQTPSNGINDEILNSPYLLWHDIWSKCWTDWLLSGKSGRDQNSGQGCFWDSFKRWVCGKVFPRREGSLELVFPSGEFIQSIFSEC